MISNKEAEDSLKQQTFVSHPEISQFVLSFCLVQTLPDRLTITSTHEPYFTQIFEIVLAILNNLPETPVSQLGINLTYHYQYTKEESWHEFGNKIVPKDLWNSIGNQSGLKKLDIEIQRNDDYMGVINVATGLSSRIDRTQYGMMIGVNDHHDLFDEDKKGQRVRPVNSKICHDTLANAFKASIANSQSIIEKVLEYGNA